MIDWEQTTGLSKVYHVNTNIEDQRDLPKDMLGPIIVNDNNEPIVIRYPLEKTIPHTVKDQQDSYSVSVTILLDSKIELVRENTYQITNQIETWFVLYLTAWPLNLPYDQDDKIRQEKIPTIVTPSTTQEPQATSYHSKTKQQENTTDNTQDTITTTTKTRKIT